MIGFGVDLHPGYQASFSFSEARDQGYLFAFIKTSQGTRYVPHGFRDYFRRAESHMPLMGLYHFLEAGTSGSAQALHFLDTAERVGGVRDRLVAIDFESYGERSPSNSQLANFIHTVKENTRNHPVIVYSTLGFWTGGDPSGDFDQYGGDALWDARVWFAEERRPRPKSFYENAWLPWYEEEPRYAGVHNPLLRQFTWGGFVGGLYVDTDACINMERLRELA